MSAFGSKADVDRTSGHVRFHIWAMIEESLEGTSQMLDSVQ